jgi:hypothetical protein
LDVKAVPPKAYVQGTATIIITDVLLITKIMKKLKKSFLPFLAITLLINGCSKDRIQLFPTDYNAANTTSYLNSKKQAEQTFTIDSTGSGPIIGNQGTNIWLNKSCLVKVINGDTVDWPYTVKLIELYTPKDMIYYQMPTVASGTILRTDGEIRLRAFKNNDELMLKPGCTAQVLMPNSNPQINMQAFYGTAPSVYWENDPLSTGVTPFSIDPLGYMASIVKLGWINCGALAGSGSSSTLTFTSTTDNLTNVSIFIYIPATRTVMQVNNMVSGLIPNGSFVKVVGIGMTAVGDLYSFNQSLTVNSTQTLDVSLAATSDAALTAYLDAL